MPDSNLYTLVSVNRNPERAKRIITRVVEEVKDTYTIQYVANCPNIEALPGILSDVQPDVLFCASTWTPTESKAIIETANKAVPGVKTHVVPIGLVDRDGEDAMVGYLKGIIGTLLAETPQE